MLASAATTAVMWVDRCGSFCPGSIDEAQFAEFFDDESRYPGKSIMYLGEFFGGSHGVDEN